MKAERFLSQVELSLFLGVSRQRIHSLTKKGVLMKDASGIYDLENEQNSAYLAARRSPKTAKPAPGSRVPSGRKGMRIVPDEDALDDGLGDDLDEDDEDESLLDLKIRKIRAEVKKRELEIATIEGAVIDERIISSLIDAFGQGIRLNFVDVCLRQSEQICAMLGCPGKEREVQEYLEVDNGRRLEEVKRNVEKIKNTMRRVRIERGLDKEEGRR